MNAPLPEIVEKALLVVKTFGTPPEGQWTHPPDNEIFSAKGMRIQISDNIFEGFMDSNRDIGVIISNSGTLVYSAATNQSGHYSPYVIPYSVDVHKHIPGLWEIVLEYFYQKAVQQNGVATELPETNTDDRRLWHGYRG